MFHSLVCYVGCICLFLFKTCWKLVKVVGELIAAVVCFTSRPRDSPPDEFCEPRFVQGRPLYMEHVPVQGSNKLVHPDEIFVT